MKPIERKTIISLVVTAAFIVIIIILLAGKHHRDEQNLNNVPVGTDQAGAIVSQQPKLVSIDEDNYLYGISGSYPQFPQAGALFNSSIKRAFTNEIAQFKKTANDDYKARRETGGEDFEKQFASGGMYTYQIDTDIMQSNDQYISAVVHFGGFSGGAHGYNNVRTFNYDVVNHREMTLSDLYPNDPDYLTKISTMAREMLAKKLATAGNAQLDSNALSMLNDGTDPTKPINYQAFTFTKDSITIYFGEYQVAPYVFGEQTITIARQ